MTAVAAGQIILADHNNDLNNLIDAWTTFTPTWESSGTAPVIGNGTLTGKYTQAGKLVHFRLTLVPGSTTTFGTGTYFLGLPVPAVSLADADGGAMVYPCLLIDTSASARQVAAGTLDTTSRFLMLTYQGTIVAATAPWTWANTDAIRVSGTYEAA